MAESRDTVQCLDGKGVRCVWLESPNDNATLGQTSLHWTVQGAVITWETRTDRTLQRRQMGWWGGGPTRSSTREPLGQSKRLVSLGLLHLLYLV